MRGQREHRQREAQEAVAAHLQQDRGQDHRARGRRLDMGVRQPGVDRPHRHLHRKGGKERQPRPGLQGARHRGVHQGRNIGGAGIPVQRHDRQQHQDRAEQRVEEELEGGIDPARAAPHPDDQEHRDQAALEEQIEQHEIERAEGADHQRFQQQERHHVFAHPHRHRFPARQDAERHQGGGQDHERQRNAVDAHVIGDAAGEPRRLLDELEIRLRRVEAPDQDQRHREGDQRGPQRDPARIAAGGFVVAAADIDQQRADQRQEGDDGENGPGCHHWPPDAEHEPGDQSGDPDQHRKRVVIEIAGLQLDHVAGDVEHPRRHAIGTEAVDDVAVADLPQEASEPFRRTHEDQVVEFVEIPFVEQELVEHRLLVGEFDRNIGPADIEQPRHHERPAPSSPSAGT